MRIIYQILGALICAACFFLVGCEEQGLLVNSNEVSYLRFNKDMTKDTTTVSFKVYNEGENARIPIEVAISGKIQDADFPFAVSADKERTTLPEELYELPSDCRIRKGLLVDTIYVTLKNAPLLAEETRLLALQVDEREGLKQGSYVYARALISVTDRLFQPNWWLVNDIGTADNPANSVESYYLGAYSEKKYQMFLDELKQDNVVFDGKDKQVLRKYSLKLKNTLKRLNAGKDKKDWLKDENNVVIEVVVAG